MRKNKEIVTPVEAVEWRKPLTPGDIIRRRFFDPLGVTQADFCNKHELNRSSFNRILNGEQSISARTATDLSRAFGMSAMFFLTLQNRYDLYICDRDRK